jgi:hypothetical protein
MEKPIMPDASGMLYRSRPAAALRTAVDARKRPREHALHYRTRSVYLADLSYPVMGYEGNN